MGHEVKKSEENLKPTASEKQLSSTEQSGTSHGENVWQPCSWEAVEQRVRDGLGQNWPSDSGWWWWWWWWWWWCM